MSILFLIIIIFFLHLTDIYHSRESVNDHYCAETTTTTEKKIKKVK